MSILKKIKSFLTILPIFFMFFPLLPVTVNATEYEHPPKRNASEILRKHMISGPLVQVNKKVITDGYMHRYSVTSDFGVFKVVGDYGLRKLIREIGAIAKLKQMKKSDVYLDSLKAAAKKPAQFGKDLIVEPVDTVSGVPKGVFTLFGNISKGIREKKDPSEDARYKQMLLMSSYKRDLAYELGVDVYSSNRVLQEGLNSLGWAGALGSWSLTALLGPADADGAKALKTTRFSKSLNEIIKKEPPSRLRIINERKLDSMGVDASLAKQFLDHPNFTPRHDTVIVEALNQLKGAKGRGSFLKLATSANDEETANFFQNMAELLQGYHLSVSPIVQIRIISGVVLAKTRQANVLMPFPLDHGVWTEDPDRIWTDVVAQYNASGMKGQLELWVTGTVSSKTRQALEKMGIRVNENVDERIQLIY